MDTLKNILIVDLTEENKALKKLNRRLLNHINKATAPYRHTGEVSERAMVDLCNYQIDAEVELERIKKESTV